VRFLLLVLMILVLFSYKSYFDRWELEELNDCPLV
jgi:hypothetical protein